MKNKNDKETLETLVVYNDIHSRKSKYVMIFKFNKIWQICSFHQNQYILEESKFSYVGPLNGW